MSPPGSLGRNPWLVPRLTPGTLGCNDAAEPFVCQMYADLSPGSMGLNDYGALVADRLQLGQHLTFGRGNSDSMPRIPVPRLSLNLLTFFSSVWITRAIADWSQYTVVSSSPGGGFDALTQTSMSYRWETDYGEKGLYRLKPIVTEIIILTDKSWVVAGQQSDELLRHEQGHADIALLVGYEELRELQKLRAKGVGHLRELISGVQRRFRHKAEALNIFYDSPHEADHGRNKPKQAEWDAKFDEHIHDEFAPLSDPPVAHSSAGSHRNGNRH